MRLHLKLLIFVVVAVVVGILAFNLWMPRGYHFVIAISTDRREIATIDQISEPNGFAAVADIATFRPLSKLIVSRLGNPCDMPTFRGSRVVEGRNSAIGTYVQFYKHIPASDNAQILEYLKNALQQCDPNLKGVDQTYSPLFYAIFLKHPDLVSLLLHAGARSDLRISNPGKLSDGMNAMEFVSRLESKAIDNHSRQIYREIAEIIVSKSGTYNN